MYMVLLKFSDARSRARMLMSDHNAWISEGIEAGVFLLTGSLQAGGGGAILAHGESTQALEQRIARDPFVAAGVVAAEIVEISPSRLNKRLNFLAA